MQSGPHPPLTDHVSMSQVWSLRSTAKARLHPSPWRGAAPQLSFRLADSDEQTRCHAADCSNTL